MGSLGSSLKVSTGLALSSDFYLRNYYKANPQITKASHRKALSKLELDYEDSRALRRASTKLSKGKYSEWENTEGLANSVKAYVTTYNNTIQSANSDRETRRYARQLKDLAQKHEKELESVGITIERDGSLNLNENLLKCADNDRLRKVFSKDGEFTNRVSTISRKLNNTTHNKIFSELTGTGKKINIVL